MTAATKEWHRNFRTVLSIKVARSAIDGERQGVGIRALHGRLETVLSDLGIPVACDHFLRVLVADKVRTIGEDVATHAGFTAEERIAFGAAIAESAQIAFDARQVHQLINADATPAAPAKPRDKIEIASDMSAVCRELQRQRNNEPSGRA